MNSLTIIKDDYAGSTAISNRFIDDYMEDANDAQIKVYLYLVRQMSANLPTSISDMADKFNHTEKDIIRALRYWEKMRLLNLEYDEYKNITAIRFVAPTSSYREEQRPLAPIVPLKLVTEEPVVSEPVAEEKIPTYDTITYSRDDLKRFKEEANTSQVLFIAEAYFQRPLKLKEIEILYFINDELKFSCELIDYLLQYCIERDKKDFRYILTVAMDWEKQNITTPKQAKALPGKYSKEIYSILKLLGRKSDIVPTEADYAIKWSKEYGMPFEVISEACNRTVLATDSHRIEYCDKIITSWHNNGVKNLEDISKCDASFSRKSKPSLVSSNKNSFNNMIHTDYDFDAIERQILSN